MPSGSPFVVGAAIHVLVGAYHDVDKDLVHVVTNRRRGMTRNNLDVAVGLGCTDRWIFVRDIEISHERPNCVLCLAEDHA